MAVRDADGTPLGEEGEREAPDLGESREEMIEKLRAEVAAKAEEAALNQDRFLRERAELENFRKRTQRDKAEALRFANEGLLRDLLPVVDNLERALEHAAAGSDGQGLSEGVRLVLKNALDLLERHGATRIDATGEAFDPSRHEAIARIPRPGEPPNRVVQQFLPGYLLHDRLLRAAQVGVSAPAPGQPHDASVEDRDVEKASDDD